MKKIFNLVWGVLITTLTIFSFTFAYTQEQQEAYQWAYKYWITTQPSIEAAKIDSPLTRQAFSKMIINYLWNVAWVTQIISSDPCSFPDESSIKDDLKPYAKLACDYNIMWKAGSKFNPTKPITRAQLWTALSRVLWWDKYDATGEWYYIYHLNALKQIGIMKNINNPQSYAKRWDVLVMLKRMSDKVGSNVNLNWNQISAYNTTNNITNNNTGIITESNFTEDFVITSNVYQSGNNSSSNRQEGSEHLYTLYENSNIIYTWKDWTRYYYDDNFLNKLKTTAEKKWESDLAKYLGIEAEYFKKWLDQLGSLNLDNLPEMLWINEDDIIFESMTDKQKEKLIKKLKEWVNKLIKEVKDRNTEYVNNLDQIAKNIKKDKFWLENKYKETKTFIEASNEFLNLYTEIVFKLTELAANSKDEEVDDNEAIGAAFTLMWSAFAYQGIAEEYQSYVEEWAVSTINLLGWELIN